VSFIGEEGAARGRGQCRCPFANEVLAQRSCIAAACQPLRLCVVSVALAYLSGRVRPVVDMCLHVVCLSCRYTANKSQTYIAPCRSRLQRGGHLRSLHGPKFATSLALANRVPLPRAFGPRLVWAGITPQSHVQRTPSAMVAPWSACSCDLLKCLPGGQGADALVLPRTAEVRRSLPCQGAKRGWNECIAGLSVCLAGSAATGTSASPVCLSAWQDTGTLTTPEPADAGGAASGLSVWVDSDGDSSGSEASRADSDEPMETWMLLEFCDRCRHWFACFTRCGCLGAPSYLWLLNRDQMSYSACQM
jgi:hypothetical protein